MKIKQTHISFTNDGRYACFVELDDYGAEVSVDKLYDMVSHFNNIVFYGGEPLNQNAELSKLYKKLINVNNTINIEIYTNGLIRPTGFNGTGNLKFIVNLQLKNSQLDLDKRINEKALGWHIQADSTFIFNIETVDDIDEVKMIAASHYIQNKYIHLMPANAELLNTVIKEAKTNEFNIVPKFKLWLWDSVGRN